MDPEQPANLRRVRSAIGALVLAFCRDRLALGAPVFRIAELQQYVSDSAAAAPASPDRVLRQLRREGRVDYEVTSRLHAGASPGGEAMRVKIEKVPDTGDLRLTLTLPIRRAER